MLSLIHIFETLAMARKDYDPFVEVEKTLAGLREGIAALR